MQQEATQWTGLEFDRALDLLAGYASSTLTRELVRNIEVVFHPARIEENLDQTSELLALRERYPTLEMPGLGGLIDLRPLWDRMAAGGVVDSAEARALLSFFGILHDFQEVFAKLRPADFPRLTELCAAWNNFPELQSLTAKLFNPEGDLRDSASANLSDIRRKLRRFESDVTSDLAALMAQLRDRSSEDVLLTVRSNRFVLLVPRPLLDKVPGTVVDISGSGHSVYVEPAAITKTNAERQHLFLAEQQEIRRLLLDYGQQLAQQIIGLRADLEILAKFDYVLARARWAQDLRARRPAFSSRRGFVLRGAVHPLLAKTFVPEDIHFDSERVLIVSGVNAGGKTVLLKLLGLYSLLGALGCFLPGDTQLPYLAGVCADIGDDQSTVANLSTFTAHLRFVTDLQERLERLPEDGAPLLVLIDEIGTGTEPGEGAAFAYGLVRHLAGKPVKLGVTTHYDLLKTLAFEVEGVKNISLQFDRERLRPTFHVLDNQPGQSHALAIAERWGVAPDALAIAQGVIGSQEQKMGAVIGALEAAHVEAEGIRQRLATREAELEETRRKSDSLAAELRQAKQDFGKQVERLKGELKTKMDELLVETKKKLKEKARQSVRKHDEFVKAASKTANMTRRKQAEADVALEELVADLNLPADDIPPKADWNLGDTAVIAGSQLRGSVVAIEPAKQLATLLINGRRMAVQLDQLASPAPVTASPARGAIATLSDKVKQRSRLENSFVELKQDSASTIDLHGCTTEEAREQLDEFLSDALLGGLLEIRIMHGIGSGKLRTFVQAYLKRAPQIATVRFADTRDGGTGVTIAELR